MKKIISMTRFLLVIGVLVAGFVYLPGSVEASTTHLRMSPGKVSIEEQVQKGSNEPLYTYSIKNDGTEPTVVSISTTGYLQTETTTLSLQPQQTEYFQVSLVVPSDAKTEKREDYVEVSAKQNDRDYTVSLAGKVEYEVVPPPKQSITTSTSSHHIPVIFWSLFLLPLLLLLFFFLWRTKKKKQLKTWLLENKRSITIDCSTSRYEGFLSPSTEKDKPLKFASSHTFSDFIYELTEVSFVLKDEDALLDRYMALGWSFHLVLSGDLFEATATHQEKEESLFGQSDSLYTLFDSLFPEGLHIKEVKKTNEKRE